MLEGNQLFILHFFFHLTRKKLPNLGLNSWSSLSGSYPLTIRLLSVSSAEDSIAIFIRWERLLSFRLLHKLFLISFIWGKFISTDVGATRTERLIVAAVLIVAILLVLAILLIAGILLITGILLIAAVLLIVAVLLIIATYVSYIVILQCLGIPWNVLIHPEGASPPSLPFSLHW